MTVYPYPFLRRGTGEGGGIIKCIVKKEIGELALMRHN
jgi:hypothetical protein